MKLQKSYIFKKESQRGIASLIVVLALTVSSIAVLGGGVAVNLVKLGREPASNVNKLVKDVEDQLGVLNEKKVANSFFDSLVVGTVLLPDGSFSAYKFIDGGVDMAGSRFTGSVNISYLSGYRVINYFSDEEISPFYLKDGRITSAQFLDRMIANLVLNDGVSYAIKIHQGNVRDGRLIGNFVGQTYDSGFLIAGTVDEDGKIANIVVKPGAQKTTETESTIAKNAISLFQTISKNSTVTKVLGISDYQTVGFNKPVFDIETGTWIFAGDTQGGSVTSTPVQTAVNYIQNFAQSLNNGDIFQQTAQVFQGIKEVRSGSPELSINTIDDVAEFTIDLSNVSLVIKDGDVGTGKISDGAVTVSKLSAANSATNGSCLTYDSTEGKFRWGGCGSSGGGTITGITAGNGLTGGGTTGVLSLAVSVATDGGLESNAGGVSLLTTCSPDEILKWDGSAWICATDAGGVGGGVSTLQLDDATVVSSATTVDFLGSDFDLTNSPAGEGNVSIDYTNSKITRRDQAETITTSWNFSSAPAMSAINNTGVLTLPTSTDTLIGRNTSDTLTNKTIAAGNNTISGLSVSNFSSANISQWTNNSGYLTANQTITLSGDVSGTGTTSITTTIGSGVVTLGKMANLAAYSIIGNNTGSPAAPAALTAAQVKAMLGIATSDVSGLGTIATQSAGNVFITGGSLSGLTSVSATTFTGALTGNATSATTATTANALANTDSAGQSAITAINSATAGTINTARLNSAVTTQGNTFNGISQLVKLDSSGNLPALNGSALTGLTKSQVGLSNVENTALSTWAGSASLNTIADKTVTLAKMADMATSSFLGRSSVGSGAPEVLSISTVKTMLSLSTSDISGLGTIATQSAANVSISGGNISGVYRINGADISGGSLSGTSVNGVTTANILLSTGSYSDPSWITSLSPTKVLPDQTGQNGKVLSTNGSVLSWITNSSGVAWGAITGTLSDQTDLNSALSGKLGTGLTSAYIFVGNGSGIATGVSMSGDVAIDNTGLTTIGSGKVSLSKMANLAANSIIGNNTGSPATPLALSASDVKTLLAIANTDVSGLGTIATQSAGNVFITGGQITGGTINGVVIGGTTASAGTFTTLSSTGNTTLGDANSDTLTIKAGSSGTGITFFDSSFANCSALETAGGVLTCGSDDTGAGGGIATIQAGDSDVVTSATTIDFLAADFDITNSPTGEGNVSIDYTNSKITRSDQIQSITGAWTFGDLTISDINIPLTGASLTLDFNNTLDRTLTITNTNTGVASLSVEGTLGGSNFSGTSSGTNTGDQTITLTGDVTGTGTGSFATAISANSVALTTDTTGNYVASITNGSGISGGDGGSEGVGITLALGALTADWNQTGAFDITLNNSSSELKMLESGITPSLFGILDMGDLSTSDSTFTFSGASGTVLTSANAASSLSGWDQNSSDDLTTGNYTTTLDSVYVNVGESPTAGDISGSFTAGLTIGANSVALGTDTTGNYVAGATANGGLNLTGTEGGTLGIVLPAATDALSITTSSGSGLELLATGVTLLQGCSEGQLLKWNETADTWGCAADNTGAGGSNSFETMSAPAGTNPVADSATDTLALLVIGTNFTVTGDSTGDSLTFDISESTLAGSGLAANGSALDISTGNGIQIATDAVALGPLTADWSQAGAFDIVLANTSSELKILESGVTPTLYGILDVGDLSTSDSTFTFSGASGTVLTSANASTALSTWDQDSSDDLTTANYSGSLDSVYVNVGESPTAGDISGSFTAGLTIGANSVALTTDTTGNYVASANTSALTGLTGGSTGSEGAALTLGFDYSQALTGDVGLAANAAVFGQSGLVFEGSIADISETFFAVTNPTADRTITFPNATITINAAADLSGTTLASGVTASSLTSLGTLGSLAVTGAISGATATNTINGIIINSGALSGVTTISASGQITSIVTTGTAPFVVASTTNVANLNASSLNGATFAAPGSIGSTTPGSGAFTTLSATGAITGATATNTINGLVINSGALSNATTLALSGAITAATATNTINGMIINAGAVSGVTTLGASSTVTIGSGGNTYTLDPSGTNGIAYAGTVRPTRKETMAPEYQGAVLTGTGVGTMTSDFCDNNAGNSITDVNTGDCNTNETHTFYKWTTSQGTAQTYSIYLRWRIPDNFPSDGFSAATNPIQVYGRRSDATNGSVKVYVYDTAGALNNAGGTEVGGTANTWNQGNISVSGGTWTPGSYMTLKIDLVAAASGGTSYAGEISLNYRSTN